MPTLTAPTPLPLADIFFEAATIPIGDNGAPMLLRGMREEVQRELDAALKACDQVPEYYLERDAAKDAFRALADDGDEAWTRGELREGFDMEPGFAPHFDVLMDHVNALGWAYWRLHRAERRALGRSNTAA